MATKASSHVAVAAARALTTESRVLGIQTDLSDLILRDTGQHITALIGPAITDATIQRTIDGASNVSITVDDPERALLRLPLTNAYYHASLDGLHFRYMGYTKEGESGTFKLIEHNAARLMRVFGVRKAYRDQVTRAEFVLSEVQEADGNPIPVHIAELHKVQPIKNKKDANAKKEKQQETGEHHTQAEHGLGKADEGSITVKHVKATAGQIHIIDEVLQVGESMGASFKVLVTAIMTITQESDVSILNSPSGYGAFSQLKNGAWPASGDPSTDAHGFFKVAISKDNSNPNLSKNDLAQEVQQSGVPNAYGQWEEEAIQTVERYLGGTSTTGGGSVTETVVERFPFERKKKESAWTNTGKLASDVHWRRFMVAGKFFYVPETILYEAQSRLKLDEDAPGVEEINGAYHENREVTELTVIAHAESWKVPPGCVCEITKNMGPFEGRYVVETIESSLLSSEDLITIKIAKPTKPLPEPPNPTHTKTLSTGATSSSGSGKGSANTIQLAQEAFKVQGVTKWKNGIPIAKWIYPALLWAEENGGNTDITSGYRPGYDPHTATGKSEHQGTAYPQGAIDFGDYTDPVGKEHRESFLASLAKGYPGPMLKKASFADDGHCSGNGH